MAENNTVSPSPIEEYLRVTEQFRRLSKLTEQWRQDYLSLKTPEETLKLEKEELDTKIQEARMAAHLCVLDADLRYRHEGVIKQLIDYVGRRRALEPECGCKDTERKETYDRRINECVANFPVLASLVPESVFTSLPPSPPPSASLPTEASGAILDQGPLRENDHEDGNTRHPSGAARPRTGDVASTLAGDDAVRGDTASIPGAKQGRTKKRRLLVTYNEHQKRMRVEATSTGPNSNGETATDPNHEVESDPDRDADSEYHDTADAESHDDHQVDSSNRSKSGSIVQSEPCAARPKAPEPRAARQQTIDFDDVYQDGRTKHHIAGYEGKWYIFRCDKHKMYFGEQPIKGAAKHLSADAHNRQTREHRLAVELLGIEVLNCDAEKQKMNNEAFSRALDNGYQPRNNPAAARFRPQSRPQPIVTSARARTQRGIDEAVLDPSPGGIYIALWRNSEQVGVIIIPRGCFGDPSFADVGLPGSSLAEDTVLMDKPPACYICCPNTKRILGWAPGYEDGGDRVPERQYPVMYFDGVDHLRKNSVQWFPAKDLRLYDREVCSRNKRLLSNYSWLRRFEKDREKAREAAEAAGRLGGVEEATGTSGQPEEEVPGAARQLREEEEAATSRQQEDAAEGADDSESMDTEPDLPEFTVSPPPGTPVETAQPAPQTPDTCSTALPWHHFHTAHVTDGRRNAEETHVVPDLSHIGSFASSYRSSPGYLQANIVEHAAVRGDGTMQAARGPPNGPGAQMPDAFRDAAFGATNHNSGRHDSYGGEPAILAELPPRRSIQAASEGMGSQANERPRTALPTERPRLSSAHVNASREEGWVVIRPPVTHGPRNGKPVATTPPGSDNCSQKRSPGAGRGLFQASGTSSSPIDLDGWDPHPPRTPQQHSPHLVLPEMNSLGRPFGDRPPPPPQDPARAQGGYRPNSRSPVSGSRDREPVVPEAIMSLSIAGLDFGDFVRENGEDRF